MTMKGEDSKRKRSQRQRREQAAGQLPLSSALPKLEKIKVSTVWRGESAFDVCGRFHVSIRLEMCRGKAERFE